MNKIDKFKRQLNADFRVYLAKKMKDKFGLVIKTEYNFFNMRLVTTKHDGSNFTKQQTMFIAAYSDGYTDAMTTQLKE